PLPVKEGDVGSAAFSPDGKTIAAGYSVGRGDGGVVLGNVELECWQRLAGAIAERNFTREDWSQDIGRASCRDRVGIRGVGGVVLWAVDTRKRLVEVPLPVKEGDVGSVAFSPDGKTIAAGYSVVRGDGGVVLWNVDLESWQRLAGAIANRNFTRKEWSQ